MQTEERSDALALDELYEEMGSLQLEGLWRLSDEVQAAGPRVATRPHAWRGEDVRRVLARAGELVQHSAAAERRTIRLVNPGHPGTHSATHTLAAAVQLLNPGEVAPTHRHTPAAIRWVFRGHGGYTSVDGERCTMGPGDLIITPRWAWHHHGNAGDEPVMWMDGLDIPMVFLLNAFFFEQLPSDTSLPERVSDGSERRYGNAMRPVWQSDATPQPLLTYRWADAYAALQRLADVEASPFDDVAMEYTDPRTGGHVLRTLACGLQLLRPGVHTRAHRHTSSAVYQVFRGNGYSVIDGMRLDWAEGDFFAVPTWAAHEHASLGEEVILFSLSDRPAFEALDLYREEAC